MAGQIVRTQMAEALNRAVKNCVADGGNPRRVGHRLLTNNAKGVGSRILPGGARQDKKA